jgi:hypothetical protein
VLLNNSKNPLRTNLVSKVEQSLMYGHGQFYLVNYLTGILKDLSMFAYRVYITPIGGLKDG